MICEADAKGRLGFEEKAYPQAAYLRNAFKQCLAITAKPFIEQGMQGKAIKQAIVQARIAKIKALKQA